MLVSHFPPNASRTRASQISMREQPSGRTHVIISGVTIGTCCSMPTLAMLNDGYPVFPVIAACGAWNAYEAEAAMARMSRAGAELVTVFARGCELQPARRERSVRHRQMAKATLTRRDRRL